MYHIHVYFSLSLWPNAFGLNAVLGPNTAIVLHASCRIRSGDGVSFSAKNDHSFSFSCTFRPKILVPFSGQFRLRP
jgi:hypothetical protein